MPLLAIDTNVEVAADRRPVLLQRFSSSVADILGKPEQYVMVSYRFNKDMLFAGNADPLAYMQLKSLGLPSERTPELSSLLSQLAGELLEVPAALVYIEFADPQRHMWGWNGTTFAG